MQIETVIGISSTLFRFAVFVFFRWIPGHHFPPFIYTCFCIYAASFYYTTYAGKTRTPNAPSKESRDNAEQTHANGTVKPARAPRARLQSQQIIRTLITGAPISPSPTCNSFTFNINLCLLSFVLYYIYIPATFYPSMDLTFARVGYVSDSTANILSRIPLDTASGTVSHRIAEFNLDEDRSEKLDTVLGTPLFIEDNHKTDYTTTVKLQSLESDTRYQYNISYFSRDRIRLTSQTGYFVTAPKVGTFSRRGNGKFTFLHTSCIIRNFPFKPLAHPLSIRGFQHLSAWLSELRPSFMLFLGDFIYADVPLRHGSDVEAYRRLYRQVYASPDWSTVSRIYPGSQSGAVDSSDGYDLPWIHAYDDHEIANDWSANTTGYFPAAFNPYLHYHLNPNPPLPGGPLNPSGSVDSKDTETPFLIPDDQPTYSNFTQGPAMFYILDTRRYRRPPTQDRDSTMLGKSQLDDLLQWIQQPSPPGVAWKILVSSVPFTRNWRVNAEDTWTGYVVERRKILEAMWTHGSEAGNAGIVVLSGDRHEFAATAFPPPSLLPDRDTATSATTNHKSSRWNSKGTVHEFSTSPLSQFYLPVRTYRQDKPLAEGSRVVSPEILGSQQEEDLCIKYLPKGNNKFGLVEIEQQTNSGISLLRYRLFIEGEEKWNHVLTSQMPKPK